MPVFVAGVNIFCDNCGRSFEVKSGFEAMNRRFCSEACATAFEGQAEYGTEPQSFLPIKGTKSRKRSITNSTFQKITDFLQQAEQEGYLVFDNAKEVLFREIFKARLRQRGWVIDEKTNMVRDLYETDAFDLDLCGNNSELDSTFEDERVRYVNFEEVCKNINELLGPIKTRESFQAIWDAFWEISGKK